MKGQQIFYSFLPGVTAAVLTTQPAWADTVITQVHQPTASNIPTSAFSGFVTDITSQQLSPSGDNNYPAIINLTGITGVDLKHLSNGNLGVRLRGNSVPIAETDKKDDITFALTDSNQQQSNRRQKISQTIAKRSQNVVSTTEVVKTGTQLKTFLQATTKNVAAAILQPSCKEQACRNELAQKPSTAPSTPLVTPTTVDVQIPDFLIPNSNPLQFPTKPEEVRLQGNQAISLAQALELARRNNRELQVALLTLERNQAAVREAQAALLPTFGVSTNLARQQSASGQLSSEARQNAESPLERAFNSGADSPSTTFSGQAELSYSLYTSGARQARIRQAEEQLRSQELDVERLSEEIRLNVSTEYFDLQGADESVRIAQSAVANAEASLRDAQAQERAGVGTRFDVLRSQVNLANAQQELTNSRSQQQVSRRRLATRLSIPQSANISAADPVRLAGLWNYTLENSIVLAYQNRPELQQQLAQRNISEQQRREALSALGPQISLVANYEVLDQFDDQVSLTDGYSIGLRANLNLYDGGAARARAAQARTGIAIAETQFGEQRNQIRFQVEQAYTTQQSSLENVQTSNTALEQAREALRLARLRFQAGVGTQTDVIAAENDLTRAEGNRVTAILDYNRALANLQRAVTSRATR